MRESMTPRAPGGVFGILELQDEMSPITVAVRKMILRPSGQLPLVIEEVLFASELVIGRHQFTGGAVRGFRRL